MSEPLGFRARQRMVDACAVYRIYDAGGRLVYVGMTGDLRQRFGQHASQRWFLLAETIRVEWFATEDAAREAERQAIRGEHPERNIQDRSPVRPLQLVTPGTVTLSEAVEQGVVSCTRGAADGARRSDRRADLPGRRGVAGGSALASVRPLLGVQGPQGRLEPGVVGPEVWRLRPVQGHPPPCAGRGQTGPPGTTRTEEEEVTEMGLFDGKKHEPAKARDPRPKGSQKGTTKRDAQRGPLNFGGKARSSWLSSGPKRK
jgi:predicted GIY-YIG superfamily endonuclease